MVLSEDYLCLRATPARGSTIFYSITLLPIEFTIVSISNFIVVLDTHVFAFRKIGAKKHGNKNAL